MRIVTRMPLRDATAGFVCYSRHALETLDLDAIILPAINAGGPALALSIINPAVGIGTFLTQWVFKDQLSNMFRMEYEIKGPFDDPVVEKASRTELGAEIKPAAPGERIRPLFD